MDKAIKAVKAKAAAVDNEVAKVRAELAKNPVDAEATAIQFGVYKSKLRSLTEAREKLIDLLLNEADDKTAEILVIEEDQSQSQTVCGQLEGAVKNIATATTSRGATAAASTANPHHMNLPQFPLPSFGGDVRDWLGFKAAFEPIHNNAAIPTAQKFQYLLKCIVPDSLAKRAIEEYSVVDMNYQKAYDKLEARFGKKSMLVKVYVRDLLQIVIQRHLDKNKVDLPELVGKLHSKIQNLAEFGVTTDKCEDLLYPVLEASIPESVLERWQHHPNYLEKIDNLLNFLNDVVQKDMERSLTRMNFGTDKEKSKGRQKKTEVDQETENATVAGFMNTNKQNDSSCVFCSGKHSSFECGKASSMTLEEKRAMVKEKNVCFICLRPNHSAKKCKSAKFVKCVLCKKTHNIILCPELHGKSSSTKEDKGQPPNDNEDGGAGNGRLDMVNMARRKEVLLKTLTVKAVGQEKNKPTRTAYDSLSQGSYVLERVAAELKLKKVGEETITHHTYGGNMSKPTKHNIYRMEISSLEGKTVYCFDVSGAEKISDVVPGTIDGEWVKQCQAKGIKLTDLKPVSKEIELLLGADVEAKFFTGKKCDLQSGPTAQETLLGWVISGKTPLPARAATNSAMCLISMCLMDDTVSKMWDLEVIGIRDSAERQSQVELDKSTMDHFKKTVERLPDGRYEVQLPWLEGNRKLQTNKWSCEKRLQKLTNELEQKDRILQYDKVIRSWLEEGIVEKVPATAIDKEESHYIATSVTSLEEAYQFKQAAQKLLSEAKFDLRAWEFGPVPEKKLVPVLGLLWDTQEDTLQFDLSKVKQKLDVPVTKRSLLSFAHMVFDPLGFAAPATMCPKLLFKRACEGEEKLGWDDELPPDLTREFNKWKTELVKLEAIRIPRWMAKKDTKMTGWALHVFCDASADFYATVIFLRAAGEEVSVQLIHAKTRIRPKKPITITRMELLACLLGARLASCVKEYLMMPDITTCYWTDSSTALAWIQKEKNLAPFVGNRVTEIQKLTDKEGWRHVPGESNPADLPSRGCSADSLLQGRWWEGPDWVKQDEESWPRSSSAPDQAEVDREKRKVVMAAMAVEKVMSPMKRFLQLPDYTVILRSVAFWRRECAEEQQLNQDEVTSEELKSAEEYIIKYVQETTFTGVGDPRLSKLRPFEDPVTTILKMKTKLILGDDPDTFKKPIILPGKHEFVRKVIWQEYIRSCHAGAGIVMANLRERFWILNSRRTINNVIRKCLECRRQLATSYKVEEAPLPANRIKKAKAFEITGVDLLGPLYLRGNQKVWVSLFTCAVYRAIHLEIVETLSTADFLLALSRFTGRRGRPSVIYSDNGTNFKGTDNLFKAIDWEEVKRRAAVDQIQWIFNPPTAAWWGGFWERLVGVVKQLLRRVLGNTVVNYVQLETLLCEVERTANDRPLTFMNEDPRELRPITPSLFITDIGTTNMPEIEEVTANSVNKSYRRLQSLRESLRSRFRKEYLGQLVYHGKRTSTVEAKPGDVLVEVDNRKRMEWPMGVILEVYPGKDGKVRVAKVRTNDGEYVRPVQRLFPLELQNYEKDENETCETEAIPGENLPEVDVGEGADIDAEEDSSHDEIVCNEDDIVNPVMITKSGRVSKKPVRLGIK